MALQVKKRYPIPRKVVAHDKLPQHVLKRDQRRQSLRRSTTVGLTLLTFVVIGGIAYTWFVGQQKTALVSQSKATRSTRAIFRPPKVASDAKVGVAVQTSMLQVKPGENASITVRTNPEATCSVSVKYGAVQASDSGLSAKVADEFGVVGWTWTVTPGAPKGKWPVDITCKNKQYSAIVKADLEIAP